MSEEERGEIITILLMRSNLNKAALEKMNNRKLLEAYDRHIRTNWG